MKSIQMSLNESDIYAGVFDSLNVDNIEKFISFN